MVPPGSDVRARTRGGSLFNRAMTQVLEAEAAVVGRGNLNFSFGLSIFLLAAKR